MVSMVKQHLSTHLNIIDRICERVLITTITVILKYTSFKVTTSTLPTIESTKKEGMWVHFFLNKK